MLEFAGVTRLARITDLDEIGLPIWQAVRPLSRNLTVSQGKGWCDLQAKIGAAFEALELYCSERIPADGDFGVCDLDPNLGYELSDLPGYATSPETGVPIRWKSAECISNGRKTFLPVDYLQLDFSASIIGKFWMSPSSNGLGAGFTEIEATLHGLLECIERHTIARGSRSRLKRLNAGTLPRQEMSNLLRQCESLKIALVVREFTSEIGVGCFKVWLIDNGAGTLYYGSACRLARSAALEAAVLEAVQSRMTAIAGARDDISDGEYRRRGSVRADDLEPLDPIVSDVPEIASLEDLIGAVKKHGFSPIRCSIGKGNDWSVVRVVVPRFAGPRSYP